jgi:hypothetical protein
MATPESSSSTRRPIKDAAAAAIVKDMQTAAKNLFRSIDETVKTARYGYSFAKEAETLCDYLLDPSAAYGDQSIQNCIKGMQQTAKEASEKASSAAESSRKSRVEFDRVRDVSIVSEDAKILLKDHCVGWGCH